MGSAAFGALSEVAPERVAGVHGGHFAAVEQPESLVDQVRGFFRLVR